MSVYSKKGKGWRYDFTIQGIRHTKAWFKTKREAIRAANKRREEALEEKTSVLMEPTGTVAERTDITFLEMVNRRLDHVKAYKSHKYYQDHVYLAKRWVKRWGQLKASAVTTDMVDDFVLERKIKSAFVANQEIRYLRATFNFAKKKKIVTTNPLDDIDFVPEERRIKYVPSSEDIDKVIAVADPDTQDYLWVIRDTFARVGEINKLIWDDVHLNDCYIVLYTRKKKGGDLTPRKVPMTENVKDILSRRYKHRDKNIPFVFWHRYWSSKKGDWEQGAFQDRKRIMGTLCKKAGVTYFRFHALRHAGASVMENSNISTGIIQKILGHESRRTTEIYLHNLGKSERQAMDVYESARKNSHTNSHTAV